MTRRRLFTKPDPSADPRSGYQRFIAARPGQRMALIKGQDASRYTDFYHVILAMSWPAFFALAALAFLLIIVFFATLYRLDPTGIANSNPVSDWDRFQFSAQTLATMNSGMTARSRYIGVVSLIEAFFGILNIATLTGIIFARISRPLARVLFSKYAVIMPYDGEPTLMFRTANQRGNQIMDASVTVSLARQYLTAEGIVMRRFEELTLVRPRSLLFALSWTVLHKIDEASPLYGATAETLAAGQAELFVLIQGHDDLLNETIFARHSYRMDEILWNRRFVDVLSLSPGGRRVVDLTRFHDTVAFDAPAEDSRVPEPGPSFFWSN